MARARASRQQVELLDADERVEAAPRRRIRWWWAAAPLVLVAALLVVQTVVDARERASEARLAALPGVVAPIDESVGVRWSPAVGSDALFTAGIQAGGSVIGLVHGPDGSQRLVAFDERSGSQRWSTPLLAADPRGVLTPRGVPIGGCQRADDDAVCLVTDGYVEYGIDPPALVPSDRSSLVRVDVDDGRVLATRSAPRVTSFAVLPGTVVTGRPTPGGLSVVATDLATGHVRWTRTQGPGPLSSRSTVFAAAGGVAVWMASGKVTLLDPDGTVVRADVDARISTTVEASTGALIASSTDGSGRRVSSDVRAGPTVTYPGTRMELAVDDGSVPGLVLTTGRDAGDPTIDAFDRGSGRHRWSLARSGFGEALVLLGRVYVLTADGVV